MWHVYINPSWLAMGLASVAGLLAGCGIVLLVLYLPQRMDNDWADHCKAQTGHAPLERAVSGALPPWQRVMIVAMTAALFALCAGRFGASPAGLAGMVLCAAVVALAWIDIRSGLLPDIITLPLLWAGLLFNLNAGFTTLASAVLGSVMGYLFLWIIFHVFRVLTGREGMGQGDFKFLAALGAWLGWQQLPTLLLVSSVAGIVGGLALRLMGRVRRGQPLPFGPYLAAAGLAALLARVSPH